jgi:hypothetical protein
MKLHDMAKGLGQTLHPEQGHGLCESIIAFAITLTVCAMLILEIPIPTQMWAILTSIGAFLWGRNVGVQSINDCRSSKSKQN